MINHEPPVSTIQPQYGLKLIDPQDSAFRNFIKYLAKIVVDDLLAEQETAKALPSSD